MPAAKRSAKGFWLFRGPRENVSDGYFGRLLEDIYARQAISRCVATMPLIAREETFAELDTGRLNPLL